MLVPVNAICVDAGAGANIEDAIIEARILATNLDYQVVLLFNGIALRITRDSRLSEAMTFYSSFHPGKR